MGGSLVLAIPIPVRPSLAVGTYVHYIYSVERASCIVAKSRWLY